MVYPLTLTPVARGIVSSVTKFFGCENKQLQKEIEKFTMLVEYIEDKPTQQDSRVEEPARTRYEWVGAQLQPLDWL